MEGACYARLSTDRIVVIGSPLEATLVLGDASKCNLSDVVLHAQDLLGLDCFDSAGAILATLWIAPSVPHTRSL